MTEEQKQNLITVARNSVRAAVAGEKIEKPVSADAELNAKCGCFVTLKNNGRLRGCIGQFTSDKALIELVSEMAKAAATADARFFSDRIESAEVSRLDIEISVLSPLKRTNEPLSLRLGTDGIYIKKGFASGCFLPQVADEAGWDKNEFLSYCCSHKAGLSPDAWRDKDTEVYLFTAEIIEES